MCFDMVPEAGLEPACPLQTGDFKSPVYTISPLGPCIAAQQYLLYVIFFGVVNWF